MLHVYRELHAQVCCVVFGSRSSYHCLLNLYTEIKNRNTFCKHSSSPSWRGEKEKKPEESLISMFTKHSWHWKTGRQKWKACHATSLVAAGVTSPPTEMGLPSRFPCWQKLQLNCWELGQQLSVLLKSRICGREGRSRELAKAAWSWNHLQQPWHRQAFLVGDAAGGTGSPEESVYTAHSTKVLPVQHPEVWARASGLMCVTGAFPGDCPEGSKTLGWGWHMTYSWSTLLSGSWRVSRTPCEHSQRHEHLSLAVWILLVQISLDQAEQWEF